MCISFRKRVGEFYEEHQPTSTAQIELDDLRQLLKKWFPKAIVMLGENYRFLCNHDDIAVFLAQDQTNKFEYIADEEQISSYDCNVFASRLMGQFSVPGWADLTFGKVWLLQPNHALNCLIDIDKEFWYVEPQSDHLLNWGSYNPGFVRFIEM